MTKLDAIYKVHENLYIGAYWPRIDFEELKKEEITAIVNVMENDLYDPRPEGFHYLFKGFPDNTYPSHLFLKEILDFIDEHIKKRKGKVFVHCSMGISRSGGIVIAWLLKENPNWTWSDAFKYVGKSKIILPAVEIRESIIDYLEKIEGKRRII